MVGQVIDGRYRVLALRDQGPEQAEFVVVDGTAPQQLSLTAIAAPPAEAAQLGREIALAARVHHPSLLRVEGSGSAWLLDTACVYVVTELVDLTLTEMIQQQGRPSVAACRELLAQLIQGLRYLHEQGLVLRTLRPSSIARTKGAWKLADLSRLRAPGQDDPDSDAWPATPYVPPEAASGDVRFGWDVWSLGATLRAVLGPALATSPFARLVEGCLEEDPSRRLTLGDVSAALEQQDKAPAPPPVSAPPPPADVPAPKLYPEAESEPARRLPSRPILAAAAVLVGIGGWWLTRGPATTTSPEKTTTDPPPATRAADPVKAAPDKPAPVPPAEPKPQPTAPPANNKKAERTAKTGTGGEVGRADYYVFRGNGQRTASGETAATGQYTAAHRSYPFGTRLRVTNLANGKSVIVRVNDRGAFGGRIISVSEPAARELGFVRAGSARVRLEVVK